MKYEYDKEKAESNKKSTKSASKKQSRSSKTLISLSKQISSTAKKKKGSSPLATQQKKNVSLLSSVNTKTSGGKSQESSLQDTLKSLKKRSLNEQKQGESGFVKPNTKEKNILKKTKFADAMGRPKKNDGEKLQVESIRFSLIEKEQLITAAKQRGFLSWKKYVKYVALEQAKKYA